MRWHVHDPEVRCVAHEGRLGASHMTHRLDRNDGAQVTHPRIAKIHRRAADGFSRAAEASVHRPARFLAHLAVVPVSVVAVRVHVIPTDYRAQRNLPFLLESLHDDAELLSRSGVENVSRIGLRPAHVARNRVGRNATHIRLIGICSVSPEHRNPR